MSPPRAFFCEFSEDIQSNLSIENLWTACCFFNDHTFVSKLLTRICEDICFVFVKIRKDNSEKNNCPLITETLLSNYSQMLLKINDFTDMF